MYKRQKLGSKTFTSEYHFAAGGYGTGSVTNLVASITQPGCICGYGYDAVSYTHLDVYKRQIIGLLLKIACFGGNL